MQVFYLWVKDFEYERVVCETIFYCVQDNEKLLSLMNWSLPYAQRSMYRMHPEVCCALKDDTFNNQLNQLRFFWWSRNDFTGKL